MGLFFSILEAFRKNCESRKS